MKYRGRVIIAFGLCLIFAFHLRSAGMDRDQSNDIQDERWLIASLCDAFEIEGKTTRVDLGSHFEQHFRPGMEFSAVVADIAKAMTRIHLDRDTRWAFRLSKDRIIVSIAHVQRTREYSRLVIFFKFAKNGRLEDCDNAFEYGTDDEPE